MRVYEDSSLWAQEFSIDAALELKDDGRFHYSEDWHCYGAGFSRHARGGWQQDGRKIVLNFETAEEGLYFSWAAGQQLTAIEEDKLLKFAGDFSMYLSRDDSPKSSAPPQTNEVSKTENINQPRVAKLFFKDGSVQERTFPKDSMFGLFTQTYYRLVDEHGQPTHLFQLRQNSEQQDSSVIEYEEMEISSNDN